LIRKFVSIIAILALLVTLSSCGISGSDEPETFIPHDDLPDGVYSLGHIFEFMDFEITIGTYIGWSTAPESSMYEGRPLFYFPITVQNLSSGESRSLYDYFNGAFSPNGTILDRMFGGVSIQPIGREPVTSYMKVWYEGDGEYVIELRDQNLLRMFGNDEQAEIRIEIEADEETAILWQDEFVVASISTDIYHGDISSTYQPLTLGDTFIFNGFKITIGDEVAGFTGIDSMHERHDGREVFYIPVIMTNTSEESRRFVYMNFRMYGPDEERMPYFGFISATFHNHLSGDVSFERIGDLRPGSYTTAYFILRYEGDGEYRIVFRTRHETPSDFSKIIFFLEDRMIVE